MATKPGSQRVIAPGSSPGSGWSGGGWCWAMLQEASDRVPTGMESTAGTYPYVPLVASLSSLLPHSCFMRSPPNKPPAPMCSAQPGFSEHTNGDKRFYKNSFPGEGHTPHNNHSDFLLSSQVVAYEWQMALAMRAFEKFQDRQWHF